MRLVDIELRFVPTSVVDNAAGANQHVQYAARLLLQWRKQYATDDGMLQWTEWTPVPTATPTGGCR